MKATLTALLAAIVLSLFAPVARSEDLAGLEARRAAIRNEIATYESLLDKKGEVLVPGFFLNVYGREVAFWNSMDIDAVPPHVLTDIVLFMKVRGYSSATDLARQLLLFDRALRGEIREQVLPVLTATLADLDARIAAMQAPPAPPAAGVAPSGGSTASQTADAADDTAFLWSGGLDEIAMIEATDAVEKGGETTLVDYSASSASIIIDPDGKVEMRGPVQCRVTTRTRTSDGDELTVTTDTTYAVEGPVALKGASFKVTARTHRVATTRKNTGWRQEGDATIVRDATLRRDSNGEFWLLVIENGQPSVPNVPWRLSRATE